MLIRLGYDIELENSRPQSVLAMLNVHPSRSADLLESDEVSVSPEAATEEYQDSFGNRCLRISANQGPLRLQGSTLIRDSGQPDPVAWDAPQMAIDQLPPEVLQFLLGSRYCEVDRLSD